MKVASNNVSDKGQNNDYYDYIIRDRLTESQGHDINTLPDYETEKNTKMTFSTEI